MKKLFAILAVATTLASCGGAYTKLYYTDFTRYADEGMYITPFSDYSGHPYSPVSNFMIEHFIGGAGQEETDFQGMTDALVDAAKSVGANGIMNFNIQVKDFTWYASGTAVIFEDMPKIYTPETVKAGETTPTAPATNYTGEELAKRTASYCIEHEIEPFSINNKLWNNDTVYDLNAKRYIDEELYIEKYGTDSVNALKKAHKEAKRQPRK